MEELPTEILFYILNEIDDISLCFRKLLQTNKTLFGRLLGNDAFWYRQWLLCFSTELETVERSACRQFISDKDPKQKYELLNKSSGSALDSVAPEVSDWFWLFRARALLSHAWVKRRFQTQVFKKPSQSRIYLVNKNPDLLGVLLPTSSVMTIHSLRNEVKHFVQLPSLTEEICFLVANGPWLLTDVRSPIDEETTTVERIINVFNFKKCTSYDMRINPSQVKNGYLGFREPILVLEKNSNSTPECVIIDIRETVYSPTTISIEPQAVGVFEEKLGMNEKKVQLEGYAINKVLLHPRLPIVMILVSGQVHFYMYHGDIGTDKHVTHLLNIDLDSQVIHGHWSEFEFPEAVWQKQPDRQSGYIDESCAIINWLVHPLDPFVASTNSGIYCMKISIDSKNMTDTKCESCGESHKVPQLHIDWRTRFIVKSWTEANDWRHYDENLIFSFNPRNILSVAIRTHSKFVFLILTLDSGVYNRFAEIEVMSKYSKYHIDKFPDVKPMLSVMNKQLCQLQFICCESGRLLDSWSFRDNTKSPRKLKRRTRHVSVASINEEALMVTPQLHYMFFGENVHRTIQHSVTKSLKSL